MVDARLFWQAEIDPRVIVVEAHPARQDSDAFDLFAQRVPAILLQRSGEHDELLLNPGPRSIRLSIAKGTLLDGPVRLSYHLDGIGQLDARLLALRRFASLQRTGRVPVSLYPTARRIRRWTLVIKTLAALAVDPSYRAVAISLFGDAAVADARTGSSDFLQARVRRLVADARRLASGGYRDLLRAL